MNEQGQEKMLRELSKYRGEYDSFPKNPTATPHEFYLDNGTYLEVDAEVLYSMVRQLKPRRVVEVGSGFTTLLVAKAIRKNSEEDSGYRCDFSAIEPYPSPVLKEGFPGLTKLIEAPVQKVPFGLFESLAENDILLIDSSHVLKIGSDVLREYLEIVPKLKKGVVVHVHDIFFPREYPREWVKDEHRFWTEQYLLQAFLAFNDSYEVMLSTSYLDDLHPDWLAAAFGTYVKGRSRPCAFWMRRSR